MPESSDRIDEVLDDMKHRDQIEGPARRHIEELNLKDVEGQPVSGEDGEPRRDFDPDRLPAALAQTRQETPASTADVQGPPHGPPHKLRKNISQRAFDEAIPLSGERFAVHDTVEVAVPVAIVVDRRDLGPFR